MDLRTHPVRVWAEAHLGYALGLTFRPLAYTIDIMIRILAMPFGITGKGNHHAQIKIFISKDPGYFHDACSYADSWWLWI